MSTGLAADAMEPDFQCVWTHSELGFMASWRTRNALVVVLAVLVLHEFASRGFLSRQ